MTLCKWGRECIEGGTHGMEVGLIWMAGEVQ